MAVPQEGRERPKKRIREGTKPSSLSKQVGGDHYKGLQIEPTEYAQANGLGFKEFTAIKYISRHDLQDSETESIKDVKKAMHYLEMILDMDYGISSEEPVKNTKIPSKLYVRNTLSQAKRSLQILGMDEGEWMPMGIGQTTVGYGFDKIVFDVNEEILTEIQAEQYRDWRVNSVHCRLNHRDEGAIIDI